MLKKIARFFKSQAKLEMEDRINKSNFSAGLVALIAEWRELGEHWWEMSEKENNKPQKREFSGFAETFECCADMLEKLTEKSK